MSNQTRIEAIALGREAFARSVGVKYEEVIFAGDVLEHGSLSHKFKWGNGGNLVEGRFFQDGIDHGTVFITKKVSNGVLMFPDTYHIFSREKNLVLIAA